MRTSAHDAVLLGIMPVSLLPAACGRSQTGQGNGAGDGDEGNLLLIQPGTGQIFAKMTAPPLTVADAEAIEREGKAAVTGVAPVIRIRTQVRHDDKTFTPLFLHPPRRTTSARAHGTWNRAASGTTRRTTRAPRCVCSDRPWPMSSLATLRPSARTSSSTAVR